jgi:serine/threonine-protein kinase HipA
MTFICTIQLYNDHAWHDVANVRLMGQENQGWRARTSSGYSLEWVVQHIGERGMCALSCRWPVGLEPLDKPHWPVFLIDMLPQGFGRHELLRRIGIAPHVDLSADWRLLLVGAGNPVGHLRVKEAAAWLAEQDGPTRGFTDAEVAARGDAFSEYLATHGLFVAGSSGVQGEWPKLLLTRARDGLLYLDHTVPDEQASEHFIVKFGRGADRDLAAILAHEAPYMALAKRLGLRVHGPLTLKGRALFIPRFDRQVADRRVHRLAQESIASLTGMPGFDAVPSHDTVCRELIRRCTHPQAEVLEYIKRDIANLALGNKDNHARNTAIQRLPNGQCALTPLYDFAPMYLHPDGIARRIRWEGNDAGRPDWERVLDRIMALTQEVATQEQELVGKHLNRAELATGLRDMAPALRDIALNGQSYGLAPEVHAHLTLGLLSLADQLNAMA